MLTYLSIKENEITDVALENVCSIANMLPHLKTLDIEGNLFYRVRKFRELVAKLSLDPERSHYLDINHTNIHKYDLIDK